MFPALKLLTTTGLYVESTVTHLPHRTILEVLGFIIVLHRVRYSLMNLISLCQ